MRICSIYYDKADETELLIDILSFGPVVRVLGPEPFLGLIKAESGGSTGYFSRYEQTTVHTVGVPARYFHAHSARKYLAEHGGKQRFLPFLCIAEHVTACRTIFLRGCEL